MIMNVDIGAGNSDVYTQAIYQYDRNVRIVISGTDIPNEYHVYFSNNKEGGVGIACTYDQDGVSVPNALLLSGRYVYGWLIDKNKRDGRGTFGSIIIPVIPRPIPVSKIASDDSGGYRIDYEIDEDDENFIIKQTRD